MSRAQLSRLQDYELADTNQDLRGWKVQSASGNPLGMIVDMIVDTDKECVTAILLDNQTEYSIYDLHVAGHSILIAPGVEPIAEPLNTPDAPPRSLASDNLVVPVAASHKWSGKRLSEVGELRVSRRIAEDSAQEKVHEREEEAQTLQSPADPLLRMSPHRPVSAIP